MNAIINNELASSGQRIHSMIASENTDADSFYLEQALAFSLAWADDYAKTHQFDRAGMTPAATSVLAMARLGWLLKAGRCGLDNLITVEDFLVLCNTFQDEIATVDDFASLATAVADEYGLEFETYKDSQLGPLLDKLMGLSLIQSAALRDLVERFWNEGQGYESVEAFLVRNGVTPSKG